MLVLGTEQVVAKLSGHRLTNWYYDYRTVIEDDSAFVQQTAAAGGMHYDWCVCV